MSEWIALSKILPQVIYPFNLMLWLLIFAFLFLLLRYRKLAGISLSLALAVLLICGSPLSTALYRWHEQQFLPVNIDQSPTADAIVLLAGDVGLPLPPRVASEVGGNRAIHALRLFKTGKSQLIVISGGNVFPQKGVQAESFYTAALLRGWGIPSEAILIEAQSRNTYENAIETQKLLNSIGIDQILLVTSAFHMPRALATFRTAGLKAIPSPASYAIVDYSRPVILDWLPSLGNLGKMQAVIREKLGIFVYRYRGWIA